MRQAWEKCGAVYMPERGSSNYEHILAKLFDVPAEFEAQGIKANAPFVPIPSRNISRLAINRGCDDTQKRPVILGARVHPNGVKAASVTAQEGVMGRPIGSPESDATSGPFGDPHTKDVNVRTVSATLHPQGYGVMTLHSETGPQIIRGVTPVEVASFLNICFVVADLKLQEAQQQVAA